MPDSIRNGGVFLPEGLILKGVGGFYQVKSKEGFYECRVRGIFRKKGITPLPGDCVDFTITDETAKEGWIEQIRQRQNYFNRPPVANINRLAVVLAAAQPSPDFLLADKIIISALLNGIEPIVIINKADLVERGVIDEIKKIYKKTGFSIIQMSKVTMEGYACLHEKLKGRCTVFAGQSGVGKSTILNNIISSSVMETGEVSKKIKRGKQTTRHVQLIPLDYGGYVVDTPGFSFMTPEGVQHNELSWMYPEFEKYQTLCRFNGCSHIREPGCSVKSAVNAGEISEKRYECYRRIYEELKESYEKRYE
jgi:ribosome biogenesis GTPase